MADIRDAVLSAERWFRDSWGRQRREGSSVRAYLAHHDLAEMLEPVAADHAADLNAVRQWVERLDHDYVAQRIQAINVQIARPKPREIAGPARDLILHDIEEARRIAARWCAAVAQRELVEDRGEWLLR